MIKKTCTISKKEKNGYIYSINSVISYNYIKKTKLQYILELFHTLELITLCNVCPLCISEVQVQITYFNMFDMLSFIISILLGLSESKVFFPPPHLEYLFLLFPTSLHHTLTSLPEHMSVLSRLVYLELANLWQLRYSPSGPKAKLRSLFTC